MKKGMIVALAMSLLTTIGATAQQDVTPGQKSKIVMAGNFNSTTVAGGSSTTAAKALRTFTGAENVLYTKRDTVTDAGVDTFKARLVGNYNSVYTWVSAKSITGTNTSCTVRLWAGGDVGSGVDFVPLYTATVSATNPVGYYLVNSGNKWPYSNFWWTFTGSSTHASSWYGGVLIR